MKHRISKIWLLAVWTVALLTRILIAQGAPISDDFSNGNDDGWTRYQPLGPFGAAATYSFPDTGGPFGVGYRIQATASPDPATLGFGRAGSLRLDTFVNDPAPSVYVVAWDNSLAQSFGILTQVSSPGRGTTDGYAFTYSTAGIVSLSRIDNEQFTVLASTPASLDPSRDYVFLLRAFPSGGIAGDLGDAQTGGGVAHLTAGDRTYPAGITGLYVASNVANGAADATFDSFEFGISVPEPSSTSLVLVAGSLFVIWRFLKRARDVKRRSPPVA